MQNSSSVRLPRVFQLNNGTKYRQGRYLGRGGFAVVVSAERIDPSGESGDHKNMVAIKAMLKNKLARYAAREMEIMHRLRHNNILRFYEHFEDEQWYYLVLELCTNQSLSNVITDCTITLSNDQICDYLHQMALGCQYLYQNRVVHRDLKPNNVLLTADMTIKIADFGLARIIETSGELLLTFCGTPKYQAPEMIRRVGYDFGVDMWALGCITYRLFYGKAPFEGNTAKEVYKAIISKPVKYSRNSRHGSIVTNQEIGMMRSLLCKDPAKRVSANSFLT